MVLVGFSSSHTPANVADSLVVTVNRYALNSNTSINASHNISGSFFPRRIALRQIPSQAIGLK